MDELLMFMSKSRKVMCSEGFSTFHLSVPQLFHCVLKFSQTEVSLLP
jgi:hypothetical protein